MTTAAPAARTLMLCADDFGLSAGVSAAIVRLAQAGRLNASSCITTGAPWPEQAPRLRDAPPTLQLGLHLNLSEGRPLSAELARLWPEFPPLPRLIVLAHLRGLPRAALAAEIDAQWAAFCSATGREPQYLDGHQHVHHLPGVRECLLAQLPASLPMRNTGRVLGPGDAPKRLLIEATGGTGLQRALARRGTPHNAALLGAYDFRAQDYRRRMRAWLRQVPPEGALLFCHPGDAAPPPPAPDPIAAARVREAAYLASPAFADDLAAARVTPGPVW